MRASKGSCWVWGIAILLVLAVLGMASFYLSVRSALVAQVRQGMTDEEFAAMEEWLAKEVDFPDEWANPKPFSEELERAADEIRPVVEPWLVADSRLKEQLDSPRDPVIEKFIQGDSLSTEERDHLAELRTEAQPILEAIRTFIEVPDYELDAFSLLDYEDRDLPIKQKVNGKLIILSGSRMKLEAIALLREHDLEGAVACSNSLSRLANRDPGGSLISHLLGVNLEMVFSCTVQDLAENCEDLETLNSILLETGRLKTGNPEEFIQSPTSLSIITYLRGVKRFGIPVDLPPGRKNSFYLRQFYEVRAEGRTRKGGTPVSRFNFFGEFAPAEQFYQMAKVDDEGASLRFRMGRTSLALAQLCIAQRIGELEGKGKQTDIDKFVPDPIPSIPEDAITGKPFLWDASSEEFYSIGPDRKDDRNLFRYSPTNGVHSSGDYSLW